MKCIWNKENELMELFKKFCCVDINKAADLLRLPLMYFTQSVGADVIISVSDVKHVFYLNLSIFKSYLPNKYTLCDIVSCVLSVNIITQGSIWFVNK